MKTLLDQISSQLTALSNSFEQLRQNLPDDSDNAPGSTVDSTSDNVVQALIHYLSVTPDHNRTLLTTALQCAMAVVDGGGAGLTLYDPDKQKLVFQAALGDGAQGLVGYEVPLQDSRHGLAFATGEVQSATPLHDTVEQAAQATFKNVLVAPLLVDDEAIGTISAVNKQSGDHFTPEDMSHYQVFAELIATIVRQEQRRQVVERFVARGETGKSPLTKVTLRDQDRQLLRCLQQVQQLSSQRPTLVPVVEQLVAQLLDESA
ncbi:GAF domain-containing protein [Desulfuromonas acetoxidans]|uniref:GAF sensor protein n=1 Tax=Desulfuromonas acetoxidans (strain DSM 684 / 11070) TaxID=281689 RepID=Q1JX47_DESA6|nr:GAF domain-containing protein [Desulfuromonas acetoxidans]EAT14815.1 putative GAF sensor protein [Desulfuromonas acetoxidans DSM 684]MBF0645309.1 GAF domain-containing protein [Desulfuromonas acetoxidans]NVD25830.1 GAF domain-containing protein [Desulfuromonas acetoxidans]NVE17808.1 GAF domain-containing protein [Desulfuromonas acetoxidans]